MKIKAALLCVVAALGISASAGGPVTAGEIPTTAKVRVVDRPAVLKDDGALRLVIAAKCSPNLQAFELDVSATQYAASGFMVRMAPPSVAVCDGLWHRQRVTVHPTEGAFFTGTAKVSMFIGFYDSQADRDLGRDDTASVVVVDHSTVE